MRIVGQENEILQKEEMLMQTEVQIPAVEDLLCNYTKENALLTINSLSAERKDKLVAELFKTYHKQCYKGAR